MSERLNSATVVEKAIVHAELPKARVNTHGFFETQPMGLIEALSADRRGKPSVEFDAISALQGWVTVRGPYLFQKYLTCFKSCITRN